MADSFSVFRKYMYMYVQIHDLYTLEMIIHKNIGSRLFVVYSGSD